MQRKSNAEREDTPRETALAQCLVDGDAATNSRDRRRRGKALGISFMIEVIVLALLVAAPLISSVAKPHLNQIHPPMPIVIGIWHPSNPSRESVARPIHNQLIFLGVQLHPSSLPPVVDAHQTGEGADATILENPEGYIPGAIQVLDVGPMRSLIEPSSIEAHKTTENSGVKVSEGVQQAQLIVRVEPRYPALGIQTRTQGAVILHAIINRDGGISALEVVSGPPLLVQAARQAAREWRYLPTYLNGEPVEVETSVTVIFRLGQ
jgi:protein TonB